LPDPVKELVVSVKPKTVSRLVHSVPFQYSHSRAPAGTPTPAVARDTLRPRNFEVAPKWRYRPRRLASTGWKFSV
jgi:hypothetical protein